MRNEILELEQILEQEIAACEQLEKYIVEKKTFLIKGDIDGLLKADTEIEKYNEAVKKLEEKRKEVFPEKPSPHIKTLKQKVKDRLISIDKYNKINSELLKHAMKIIEGTIASFTKTLVPESTAYTRMGSYNKNKNIETISSIIHEA